MIGERNLRDLVAGMLADEQAIRGAPLRPNDWALSVAPDSEADGMLVACTFGLRLHVSAKVPAGTVLLRELPPEVR